MVRTQMRGQAYDQDPRNFRFPMLFWVLMALGAVTHLGA